MAITFGELVSSGDGIAKDASQVDVAGGVKAGLGLAVAKEEIDQTKIKTEELKNDLTIKQASTVNSLLTNLARANPVIAKKMVKQVREKLLQLGADPDIADYTISDDATRKRQIAIGSTVSGKLSSDPETAGRFFQDASDILGWEGAMQVYDNAQKRNLDEKKVTQQNSQFYAGLQNQKDIAAMNNQARENAADKKSGGSGGLTVGDKARDTKFAKTYTDFFDAGGAATIEANLDSLKSSLTDLEKGKTSQYTGLFGDTVQNLVDSESANVRTNITSVLIQGLKDTFGGQLSDGERKAMVESAYVSTANPKDNARRVEALINKIKSAARAKELAGQYFEENGTLKGFKGTTSFNIGDKTVKLGPESSEPKAPVSSQSSAPALNLDIEKKKQAAIDAGYSPAEVEAYVQKLMSAGK